MKRQRTRTKKKGTYRQKHEEQARGTYRPTSPFYLPPGLKAEALKCLSENKPLPAYARVG